MNTRIWLTLLRATTLISLGRNKKTLQKRLKEDIIVCRHSNRRQTTHMPMLLQLSKNSRLKVQKTTGPPKELKKRKIKKLRAEIDFSIDKMVSCRHIPMEALRAEVDKFKGCNITNCFEKWANITQDQFVLNIEKFGLTMEFSEVPPLNFSPVETEIIDAEISKLFSKGVIVNTTREPNDHDAYYSIPIHEN